MTFLQPHFLWIGLAFSAAVVAAHFIVTRQPKSEALPTARFVPASQVEAVSRSRLPSDLLLLLLRVLAILSAATAFARPVFPPDREQTVRIILADASTSSLKIGDVRDSAAKYFRQQDLLISFDSTARILSSLDSLKANSTSAGFLSPALIVALRSAAQLRDRADSIALIVVSALPGSSWDAATDTIRALWPGSIQIVRVEPRANPAPTQSNPVESDFTASDPLRFTLSLASAAQHARSVHLVRRERMGSSKDDAMILHWPSAARPSFASPAPATQHAGLVVGTTVILGPFTTRFAFTKDSLAGATVIARWIDGAPAAIQRGAGNGCVRSVNIAVPQKGDLVIRPEFVAVMQRLIEPCTPLNSAAPLADSLVLELKGGSAAAARAAFPADDAQVSPFTFWLFLAGLAFIGLEQIARRANKLTGAKVEPDRLGAAA